MARKKTEHERAIDAVTAAQWAKFGRWVYEALDGFEWNADTFQAIGECADQAKLPRVLGPDQVCVECRREIPFDAVEEVCAECGGIESKAQAARILKERKR